MKAILLVGGLGTRLRPMTLTCPKPLLPVGNLPLVERIVLNLRAHGIKEFIFLLHYQPDRFIAALGDGRRCDARFHFVVMDKDLSTAGSVKFARAYVTETTLVHSGDILADLPLRRMLAFHRRRRALVTLALHPVPAPLPYGLVLRESAGHIHRFFEKPTWPQVFSDWINASIYLIEPELINHIPGENRAVLFEHEVFPPLAAAQAAIYGFPIEGYWRDVGTPEDLRLANMDYLNGHLPQKMLAPDERTWLIPTGEKSVSHFVLGHGSKLAPDAQIETSVIGGNCAIASHAKVHGAVIFDDVEIARGVLINNAILMRGVTVDAKAEVHQHAVLAENAHVGAAAIVAANAVVRTQARVASGETMHAKRVLPTGYLRRFVDGGSLIGSIKGGMSVELMRWVGKTFALRQKQKNHDEEKMTLLLATQDEDHFNAWARALAQGMLSAGGEVHLLESVTLPLARWALQKGRHAGGIYLGADRHAALLRLAFMHPTAEDFSTEETCSLERVDLVDAPTNGKLRLLEATLLREDYLRMAINCACTAHDETVERLQPLPASILNKPVPVRVGVIGQAAEQIVTQFLALVDCAAQVDMFPLDMSAGFRRHTRAAQKAFVQSLTENVGLGVWIGGVGERIQLALPGYGMLPRGRSDALMARLLIEQDPAIQIVAGWLFPNFGQKTLPPQICRFAGCMLTAASLRPQDAASRLIGFDGRGAIAFPPLTPALLPHPQTFPEYGGIAYPDALLALAFLLRALLKISRAEFAAMIPGTMLGYRLMSCPDEAKAYLMRRLVESHGRLACAFSDGIRLEDKGDDGAGWIIVRPCAGMPALEIYWEEDTAGAVPASKLNVTVRRQLARWRLLRDN